MYIAVTADGDLSLRSREAQGSPALNCCLDQGSPTPGPRPGTGPRLGWNRAAEKNGIKKVVFFFFLSVGKIYYFEKGPDTPVCTSEPRSGVLKFGFIAAGESHAPNPLLAAHFSDKES